MSDSSKTQTEVELEETTQSVIAGLEQVAALPERLSANTTDGKAVEAALNRINGTLTLLLYAVKRKEVR